jgi:hypothetical protein
MEGMSLEDLKAYLLFGGLGVAVLFAMLRPLYLIYKSASGEDALADKGRELGFTVRPPGEPTILMRGVYKTREIVVGTPAEAVLAHETGQAMAARLVMDLALGGGSNGASRGNQAITEVDIPIYVMLSRPLPAGLIITSGDPRLSPTRPGLKRVATGDAYLDERLIIEAQDVDAARALLGRERVRHALRTVRGTIFFSVTPKYVTMTHHRIMEPERLVALFDLLSLLADALEDESDPLRSF